MFLSRVSLQHAPEARKMLLDATRNGVYGQHQLLWRLFSGDEERQFLFREEQGDGRLVPSGEPWFYTLSTEQPTDSTGVFQIESRLFEPRLQVGQRLDFRLRVNPTVCRQGKRHDVVMDAQLQWLRGECECLGLSPEGSKHQLKARLLDMATDADLLRWQEQVAQGPFGAAREERLGRQRVLNLTLKTSADRAVRDWWHSRSDGYGINVDSAAIEINGYQQHAMLGKGKNAGFSSVELSGTLQILVPETFLNQLQKGFGRAKAFGCGLMMIKPA